MLYFTYSKAFIFPHFNNSKIEWVLQLALSANLIVLFFFFAFLAEYKIIMSLTKDALWDSMKHSNFRNYMYLVSQVKEEMHL